MRFHARYCPPEAMVREYARQTREHLAARRVAEATARAAVRDMQTALRLAEEAQVRMNDLRLELQRAQLVAQQHARRVNEWSRIPEQTVDRKRPLSPLFPTPRTETPAGVVEGEATALAGHHEAAS